MYNFWSRKHINYSTWIFEFLRCQIFFSFFVIVPLSPLRSGIYLHLYFLVYQLYLVVLSVSPWSVVVLGVIGNGSGICTCFIFSIPRPSSTNFTLPNPSRPQTSSALRHWEVNFTVTDYHETTVDFRTCSWKITDSTLTDYAVPQMTPPQVMELHLSWCAKHSVQHTTTLWLGPLPRSTGMAKERGWWVHEEYWSWGNSQGQGYFFIYTLGLMKWSRNTPQWNGCHLVFQVTHQFIMIFKFRWIT